MAVPNEMLHCSEGGTFCTDDVLHHEFRVNFLDLFQDFTKLSLVRQFSFGSVDLTFVDLLKTEL